MGISRALERTGAGLDTPPPTDTPLRGRRLMLARTIWLVVALLAATIFVAGLPIEFARLQQVCVSGECEHPHLTPDSLRELQALGFSARFFATYFIASMVAFAIIWFATGAAIFWRRSDDRMALLVALFLVTFGPAFANYPLNLAAVYPFLWLPCAFVTFLGVATIGLFLYLFPDGRFVPHWTKWPAAAWVALQAPVFFFPGSPFDMGQWPDAIQLVLSLLFLGAMLAAQIYRYRRVSSPLQRQQTKWLIFSFALAIAILLGMSLLNSVATTAGITAELIGNTSIYLSLSLIPVSIGFAILRYRLWDIDILISRALVYGTLTVSVVGLYVLVVGYLGALFQTSGSLLISLAATGVVAVLFQPLRERLQRGVNRLIYGDRDDPYAALSRLGQRLGATLAPDAVLPAIVETVAQTLKLPYVAIALDLDEHGLTAASVGSPAANPLTLPLTYQGETLGRLILGPRAPGEAFVAADRRLLDDLVRQAGVAAHTVRLTTALQRLTSDLQRSRERLITAQEEERRRLRRDLHDGVGPTLASMSQRIDAATYMVRDDPDEAIELLRNLKSQVRATLADIRRLVYALRPPALDEFGLVAAIREHAAPYARAAMSDMDSARALQVTVDAPDALPPLPAAVELAAYRIALEALTNVTRHAQASACAIRLALADTGGRQALEVEISDNGVGLSDDRRAGVGLTSMRERAAELGGKCTIERATGGGTRVLAQLPLP
jgi:signal transduction histidine kinase